MSNTEITTEENGKIFIIRLPMVIDATVKAKIEENQAEWLKSTAPIYVFDMSGVLTFQKQAYVAFGHFAQTLKRNDKKIFSFGVNEKTLRQITLDGLEQVFNPLKSLNEVLQKVGIKTKATVKLDSNFINPFIVSTMNVLKIQAKIDVTPGKPRASVPGVKESNTGIAAVITMISSNFSGNISVEFPTDVFLRIYEQMLGEKHDQITDEIKDGAAEILNMIFGQAKTELNDKGYKLEKALPTILVGEKLKIHHDTTSMGLILPLHSSVGDFHLQVSLHT